MNGPLLLVAELPASGGEEALAGLADVVSEVDGVAAVTPPVVNRAGDAAILTVIPAEGPQDPATEDLVSTLRDDVLPDAVADGGLSVHVGGVTATSIDSTHNIAKRIPLLIGGVVLLSMLLLLVSFRSVAVMVKAAVMNLLSVAAAYGVVALVLQGGWAGQLVGVDTPTPLPAFVPVLMFAVLFGLSMDYEVFLVSRMREGWLRTGDNGRAILEGLAGTGRVITAAAAIMVAVFAAFIPSPDVVLKVIGVGMASAIFIDATVVRMLLVPSVMNLLGAGNWWMPDWLGRHLPELHIEGHPEAHLPATRPVDAFDGELDGREPVTAT
jgi:RND superfamily putative drug exporter